MMSFDEPQEKYQMTLGELKILHNDIEEAIADIKRSMNKQFKTINLNAFPKNVLEQVDFIKGLNFNLELLKEPMKTFIENCESNNIKDNEVLNWEYYPDSIYSSPDEKLAEIIGYHVLLGREYSQLKLLVYQTDRRRKFKNQLVFDEKENRHINLLPSDFSDKFIDSIRGRINSVLTVMSGEFDVDKINVQLSKQLNLDKINKEDYLHISFGKDGYVGYFDHQSVYTVGREVTIPAQNKKIDDFIDYYLKKTGFPESIKSNLKSLLTTLCCQGCLGFLPPFLTKKFFSLHGIGITNSGQNYSVHFSFDADGKLKIQVLVDQNRWISSDAYLNSEESLNNITSVIKIDLTLGVNIMMNAPHFSLDKTTVACSFVTPLKIPMTIEKSALKNKDRVPHHVFEPLPIFMDYLAKYLGYRSLKDFYLHEDGELNTSQGKDRLDFIDLYSFCIMVRNSKDPKGKKLSKNEVKFLEDIEKRYMEQELNSETISLEICKFVNEQLQGVGLNNDERLSYIYWLQLARELKGSEDVNDEIHKMYTSLVKEFINKDLSTLIKIAKDDQELYQLLVYPDSFFSTTVKLSDDDHAHIFAKYPTLFQGDKGAFFLTIFDDLNSNAKLLFLVEFSKNGGNIAKLSEKIFFPNDFINTLLVAVKSKNIQVLELLTDLVESAPADQVAYLRQGPMKKIMSNYLNTILTKSPHDLLQFLSELREESDGKLRLRFGAKFVMKLVKYVSQLASSNDLEAALFVSPIVLELKKLLSTESSQPKGKEISVYINDRLDSATRQAKKLIGDIKVEEESSDKLLEGMMADDKAESLIKESKIGTKKLTEAENKIKAMEMKELKHDEEKLDSPRKK